MVGSGRRLRGLSYMSRRSSPQYLHSKLHVSWYVGLRADHAESRWTVNVSTEAPKNDSIQRVKDLEAQLQLDLLGDGSPFHQGKILIVKGKSSGIRKNSWSITKVEGLI